VTLVSQQHQSIDEWMPLPGNERGWRWKKGFISNGRLSYPNIMRTIKAEFHEQVWLGY